jgi:hypothetical protein
MRFPPALSRALVVCALMALAGPARAEPRRHALYLEAGGKGGLWGLGYDAELGHRLGLGAAASFTVLDREHITVLSPYLAVRLLGQGHHRWFVHAGPTLTRVATPSPVPEWSGTASTKLSGELSSGWEYRGRLLFRMFGMLAVGERGAAPWLGASVGWTL